MKKSASIIPVMLMMVVPLFPSSGQDLDDHLTLLKPLLDKTWEALMPRLGESITRRVRWEAINEGRAIKQTTEVEKIGFKTEAWFFWDSDAGAIGVFSLSSNGNFFHGHVREEDGTILMTGYAVFPDLKLDFRNMFEFTDAGTVIDRWFTFREGAWMPGHVFELTERE